MLEMSLDNDMRNALMNGRLDDVIYLHEELNVPFTNRSIYHAAASNNPDVVRYVFDDNSPLWIAVRFFDLEFVKQIKHLKLDEISPAIDAAVQKNDFEIVEFLHTIGRSSDGTRTINKAAAKGHLEMVKYLYSLGYYAETINDTVADHPSVLEYMVSMGATVKDSMIEYAAKRGYLWTIKYLESLGVPLTGKSLKIAIDNNQPAVVSYMLSKNVQLKPSYLSSGNCLSIVRRMLPEAIVENELSRCIGLLKSSDIIEKLRYLSPIEAMKVIIDSQAISKDFLAGLYSYYLL